MISDESCDSEDWILMTDENSALCHRNKLYLYIKIRNQN